MSTGAPSVYWAPDALARRLCEVYNDASVAAHEAYPSRFVGLAILPMLDPDAALAELERVAMLPGIRGVYASTRIGDRKLDVVMEHPALDEAQRALILGGNARRLLRL